MMAPARPTFEPTRRAFGKREKYLNAVSLQRFGPDLPEHTKLKYRKHGEGTPEEVYTTDFRSDSEERENLKRISESAEHASTKRIKMLNWVNPKENSDSSEEEDDTESLLAELNQIEKDRPIGKFSIKEMTPATFTFKPAQRVFGKIEKYLNAISRQDSSRDLSEHTKLKYREHGQGTPEEAHNKDFRSELEEKANLQRVSRSKHASTKRFKLDWIDPVKNSDSSEDEDNTETLVAESNEIEKERAIEQTKKKIERQQEEEIIRMENTLSGNPLPIDYSSGRRKVDHNVKCRRGEWGIIPTWKREIRRRQEEEGIRMENIWSGNPLPIDYSSKRCKVDHEVTWRWSEWDRIPTWERENRRLQEEDIRMENIWSGNPLPIDYSSNRSKVDHKVTWRWSECDRIPPWEREIERRQEEEEIRRMENIWSGNPLQIDYNSEGSNVDHNVTWRCSECDRIPPWEREIERRQEEEIIRLENIWSGNPLQIDYSSEGSNMDHKVT